MAGATGAIGSPLVAALVRCGHEVTGTTRSAERARGLAAAGATPAVVDALDREAVKRAVSEAQPDVIVHELTAIPAEFNPRRFDQGFAQTNRLRTEGTDQLIAAAAAAGVHRFITQSFAAWAYARRGSWVKTEDDPLDDDPPAQVRRTLDGIRHLERATLEGPFEGIALRYGWFYGPGSGVSRTGPIVDAVRRRRFPIVGSGPGVWSFIHLLDAEATALAVERGEPGIYNVTDDEPTAVREWLPLFADEIGAPPPRHVPGAAVRRGAQRDDDDRAPRSFQREGQAGVRLGASVPVVASGVPRGHRLSPAVRLTVSAFLCCSPPSHSCLQAPTSRSSSNKMELGAAEFQTVQRIYRGWELFGVVVLSALASTLALKIGLRRHPTAFTPALVAVLCIVAGRFLDLHIPVNRMTINWTMLPHNWAELRASWEYSHAASASLNAAAVIALTVSLREHHDGDRVARGGLRRTQRGWCFSNKRSPVLPPPTRCGNWLANQESVRCSTACACRTRCEPIHGHKERYDDVVR